MLYVVVESFNDKVLGRVIQKDSIYPPPHTVVDEAWIEQLASGNNACKRAFIKKIVDEEALAEAKAKEDNKAKEDDSGKQNKK